MPVVRTRGAITQRYKSKKMGVAKYPRMKRRTKYKNPLKNKTMVDIGLGLPKRVKCTLKVCDTFTVTSALGVLGKQSFSCNGLYDPDITNAGHQPLYFDQLMALYDHYTVIASKIKCKIVPAASNDETLQCAIFLNDDVTTVPTTLQGIAEQSSGKQLIIPPSGHDVYYLTKSWSAKKTFGGSILGNDNLQGTASSNPTEQTYFDFYIQSAASGVSTQVYLMYEIDYICIFDELKDVAQS